MLRRFGYYSTESNGHLSEYVPWYRKRPDEIHDWIDLGIWINGETGGYLRVCTEGRNWFETDFPNWMKEPALDLQPEQRSEEHGSYIIEGLETGRVYRGHFNVVNNGVIANLPDDAIIEAPGYVDRNGISHAACRRSAARLRGRMQCQHLRSAACGRSGRSRRRHAAASSVHDGSARRRRLQSEGNLADGRRDARRAGAVAAAIWGGDC